MKYTIYADAFGPILAEQAYEEGLQTITEDLKETAMDVWPLPFAAYEAVFRRAEAELQNLRAKKEAD